MANANINSKGKRPIWLTLGILLVGLVLNQFFGINLNTLLNNKDGGGTSPKVEQTEGTSSSPNTQNTTSPKVKKQDTDRSISNKGSDTQTSTKGKKAPTTGIDTDFQRPPTGKVNKALADNELIYTKHARCRMDCRYISESEIKDILYNGKVNDRKSKPYDAPCPTYALEGVTDDQQTVRIVFADCDDVTKVITAIDLKNKYNCYCK